MVQMEVVETFLPCLVAYGGTGPRRKVVHSASPFFPSASSLLEETDVAGDEHILLELEVPDSESPLALEVPRVLDDDVREIGRGLVGLLPDKDRYVEDNLLTRLWTPDVATGAVTGTEEGAGPEGEGTSSGGVGGKVVWA